MNTQPEQTMGRAVPSPETWLRLLEAAQSLLDARANQMVTAEEWRALRDAALACGATVERDDAEVDHADP